MLFSKYKLGITCLPVKYASGIFIQNETDLPDVGFDDAISSGDIVDAANIGISSRLLPILGRVMAASD
jgi:hypothetical protein